MVVERLARFVLRRRRGTIRRFDTYRSVEKCRIVRVVSPAFRIQLSRAPGSEGESEQPWFVAGALDRLAVLRCRSEVYALGSFCHFHDFGLRSGRRGGGRFFLGILVRRRWGLLRVLVKAVLLELFEIAESAGAAAVRGVEEALDGVPDSVAVAVLEGEGEAEGAAKSSRTSSSISEISRS